MKEKDVEHGFMLRLEKGEEVIASITDFCVRRGIQSGVFHAIGAVKHAEIGYYHLEVREYFFESLPDTREVASMNGNISLVDGKPMVHAHAVLAACDESLACVGGHLRAAEVAVTLEVFLTPFAVPLTREQDDSVGLKLLSL